METVPDTLEVPDTYFRHHIETMRTHTIISLLGLAWFCAIFQTAGAQAAEMFPLSPGTYWIYEGLVKWQNESGVKEQRMTWKMAVIEQVERDGFVGYLMKGHPGDLAFYEDGRVPSDYAIIRRGNNVYHTEVSAFQRLKDSSDRLKHLVLPADLILKFPLTPGDKFGDLEMLKRHDDFYCWVVKEKRPFFAKITGVIPAASLEEYVVTFTTLPDGIIVHFTPGIGMTRYEYTHHGTISEVDMRVIEYHAGKN